MSNELTRMVEKEENQKAKKSFFSVIKKLGFAGFMFFFLKGLGWVAIFVATAIWGPDVFDGVKEFFAKLF